MAEQTHVKAAPAENRAAPIAEVALDQIVVDPDCQLRAAGSKATVQEYADAIADGASFPPVVVFRDAGGRHWLADGFHRFEAHKAAGRQTIAADVHQGERRDAVLYAASANAKHGLRRTQEDKRRAILALLSDPEWRQWSDRKIAERTATDHKTVGKLRREISGEGEGGEIPIQCKQATPPATDPKPTGLTERLLAGLPDDLLIAEVMRRGLLQEVRA
jgi:uncharacterized ParB-like nuclease family protein